eukprot:10108899-Heterocapsa_arctica.AAC.1
MERRALRGRAERRAQYVDAHAPAKEHHTQSWSTHAHTKAVSPCCQEPTADAAAMSSASKDREIMEM